MKKLSRQVIVFWLLASLVAAAQPASEWIRRWNQEEGRETQLSSDEVLFKPAQTDLLEGLTAVGFRQSDGTFLLGRLIWKSAAYSPLEGYAKVLNDLRFGDSSDLERERVFLSLLQQSHGLLGTRVYTGAPMDQTSGARPEPIRSVRGPDESHRFQVWFYEYPVSSEEGEWREVLYFVSPDGSAVKVRTLGSYYPRSENLTGFPRISSESFE